MGLDKKIGIVGAGVALSAEMLYAMNGKEFKDVIIIDETNSDSFKKYQEAIKDTSKHLFEENKFMLKVCDDYLSPPQVEQYVRDSPKVHRNDPCPCGSGLKYKKCCY